MFCLHGRGSDVYLVRYSPRPWRSVNDVIFTFYSKVLLFFHPVVSLPSADKGSRQRQTKVWRDERQRWALYLPYLRGVQGYGFLPRGSGSSSGLPYTLGFEKNEIMFWSNLFYFWKAWSREERLYEWVRWRWDQSRCLRGKGWWEHLCRGFYTSLFKDFFFYCF